ncbi:glycosyltransferase family 4 protein [Pontibacter sp. E15-1]|uniref:glycosyltransferase family 4 protein n=1 Tax=Pontibacter sp. E15-1 TaxID=2919918 RepID=UPI001F4FCD5B|nr:glycosyltransferase family 4 protein [Pontibacter sp. E15-1]MCJ8166329.1 glycosyltransferase family 4 protein [Pontibacter sp. E15-1]
MLEYKKNKLLSKVYHYVLLLISKFIKTTFIKPYIGIKQYDLLIFDDIFPYEKSLFRYIEFNNYLEGFKKTKVVSTGTALTVLNANKTIAQVIKDFKLENPSNKSFKIIEHKGLVNFNAKLIYCIFLNNIYGIIDFVDKHKIPFIFTLYPGGGFRLNDETSDKKLTRILNSPNLKKIIATQNITYDYLIDNHNCPEHLIEYIFGVVSNTTIDNAKIDYKKWKVNKDTFDICFMAGRYTPQGIDKGYDTFIAVAKELNKEYEFIRFHIVGGFDHKVIEVSDLGDNITFYGYRDSDFLNHFFSKIDLIISPNVPFKLSNGAFDGFPLGCCVEASLNGVAVLASDELNQNDGYIPNEEIIIIKPNASDILLAVKDLITNYHKMIELAERGRLKTLKLYSKEAQLERRNNLLKELIQ